MKEPQKIPPHPSGSNELDATYYLRGLPSYSVMVSPPITAEDFASAEAASSPKERLSFRKLKNLILSRYQGFMRKLLDSPSKEIRFLAKYVVNYQRSITARNV